MRATGRPISNADCSEPPSANTDWPNRVRRSSTPPSPKRTKARYTGTPMPKILPCPSQSNAEPGSTLYVVAPSLVKASKSPRANSSEASVTMNGAIFVRAMRSPLTNPISPQTTNGSRIATTRPYREPYAASTPPSAYTEPTDRSIPPEMITNVMPSAITARKELCKARSRRLSADPKRGKANHAAATPSTSTTAAPWRCRTAANAAPRSDGGAAVVAIIACSVPGRRTPRRR